MIYDWIFEALLSRYAIVLVRVDIHRLWYLPSTPPDYSNHSEVFILLNKLNINPVTWLAVFGSMYDLEVGIYPTPG